ncbi:MFS transporter [Allosediminivita pacifica]|uniref:Putative MFS family arabinose efflux permease n=1 Tax=Allosediminivita pacifica TaxID=1267769 RepID=A0A2T6A4D4_9RHOB|nr:MFS transporter [Allosediminivita pacifica]PTX38671.1 putative MFS family arabinose efflux permease [Allosediminivita pacifica]GGB28917.1 MFS transporter [Allosediminivita pacifica]
MAQTTQMDDPGHGRSVALLSVACRALAANVYLAQPLAGPIAATLGLSRQAAGTVVTMTQLGYGLGLLLIVLLADRVENRKLILWLVALAGAGLLVAGLPPAAGVFLAACLAIGLGSVCVQVLVPYAAHLAPEVRRGRVVGLVTAGLMLGIMVARPVAGLIAEVLSWPDVFRLFAVMMVVLFVVLFWRLPPLQPTETENTASVLRSMVRAPFRYPLLRQRIAYQSGLFGGFSLFWTAVPLWLMQPAWGWSEGDVGIFALTAASGALAAPLAGALADKGLGKQVTAAALAMASVGFVLTLLFPDGTLWAAAGIVVAASLINAAVTFSFVIGQRAIFGIDPGARARLNGIFMASFTLAGAVGSATGSWVLAHLGWVGVASCGLLVLVLVSIRFVRTEVCSRSRSLSR